MARWGKGRGTSLAVPLDNLFKENINCPSVARSAGVVGKWGITSFTSIRSNPYAFGSQYARSQVQDQNSPLTVPVPTPADEAPKPKKFFKSRNVVPETPPEIQPERTITPVEPPKVLSHKKDDKPKVGHHGKRGSKASIKEIPPDKDDIPKLKIHIDKTKHSKKAFVTKASKKDETHSNEVTHLSPNKRYLVRNRNKIINYSEDRSNSPLLLDDRSLTPSPPPAEDIPVPPIAPLPPIAPIKISTPKVSPSVSSPTYVKPGLLSPTNKEGKPPIVLRISKGTSRLLSTDSEDVLTSPNSDRHSVVEPHFEGEKLKISSPVSIISSPPKQEGIKITIKLDNKDRKSKHDKSSKHSEMSDRHEKSSKHSEDKHEKSSKHSEEKHEKLKHSEEKQEKLLKHSEDKHEKSSKHSEVLDKHEKLSKHIEAPDKHEKASKHTEISEVTTTRSTRASKRHKMTEYKNELNEKPTRGSSPLPGSDNYELYRTLASPEREDSANSRTPTLLNDVEMKSLHQNDSDRMTEDVEMELENLHAYDSETEPRAAIEDNNANIASKLSKSPLPEAKPPERTAGRSMRHRLNINYNEDNNFLDEVTTTRQNRHTSKNYTKKNKRKENVMQEQVSTDDSEMAEAPKSDEDLIKTLTDCDEPPSIETDVPRTRAHSKKSSRSPLNEFDDEMTPELIKSPKHSERQAKSPEKLVFKSPKRICESNIDDNDKPSVKLVIMKKKGSIFKTRPLVNEGGPMAAVKKRQLYKHKWADDGKGGQTPRREPESENATNAYDAGPDAEDSPSVTAGGLERITRYRGGSGAVTEKPNFGDDAPEPYTSVRCNKGAKEYYTVVRNVKKAHQIQEIGEFQEFNDDVEYLLDALQDNNPMSTRCLSAITLASKCTAPAFRMHVRAHGTVQKFFCALHDATNDQSLGLCTATVMFVLSQDRLNMDLDRESLELMLNLLESDVSHRNALDDCGLTSAQLAKNKERVRELCAEIKNEGKAKHLDLENITVGNLAMETLLSLTSKRAGEWFKEELRALGGIDHIVRTIRDCCMVIGFESDDPAPVMWTPQILDTLRKADRCMKVLENVTQQNEENQLYLVRQGGNSNCVSTLARLYTACIREAKTSGDSVVVGALRDTLLPTLKVLVNLSHSFGIGREVIGSSVVGEQIGIFKTSLCLVTNSSRIIPDEVDFEFSVCVLLLLINLVQNNIANVQRLIETHVRDETVVDCESESMKPAIQILIDQFYKREELARLAEQNTDAILDGEKEDEPKEKKMSHEDLYEETVAKLLQKAGVHMEHTMVGSYIVLLIGHVASSRADLEQEVRQMLPSHGFDRMSAVLNKYSSFLDLTASGEASSVAHIKVTQKIMTFLDSSDKAHSLMDAHDQVTSSTSVDCFQSPHSNQPLLYDQLNTSNGTASEYNTTSDSDHMSTSMDLDTSFN